jgi:hypothetical protein
MADSQTINLPSPDILQYLKNTDATKYYANGFVVGRTQNDMFVISVLNGNPQTVLNVSFLAAKQLLELLAKNIREVEEITGELIPAKK